jgi:beta-galactosidase
VYKFPVEIGINKMYDDNQCSSYDLEYTSWSNLPEVDFAMVDDHEWNMGQFVWTGFDYLGEPTPYGRNSWPSHSSMFGIIDLASIPKDRYYLYRSQWNKTDNTLHVLPHWTWPGREGEITPVFVYTNHPTAELFVNGKSYGKKTKTKEGSLQERYRLMWMDVIYEPGEVKVVAYNAAGNPVGEKITKTAGEPYGFKLEADRSILSADGKDLAYIYVSVVDKDGNLCPNDQRLIQFEVDGQGWYRAGGNGDPTCLDLFHLPQMHAFNGMMTAIVQSSGKKGTVTLTAKNERLKSESITIRLQ